MRVKMKLIVNLSYRSKDSCEIKDFKNQIGLRLDVWDAILVIPREKLRLLLNLWKESFNR